MESSTAGSIPKQEATTTRSRMLGKKLLGQWDIQLMILPGFILVLMFSYLPMYGVVIAFKDYNIFKGMLDGPWVGMKHFNTFFQSPDFWTIMRNTIGISLLKLGINFPAPIVLALFLNEVRRMVFKRIIQTITYLPHFLSWVVVAGFMASLLSVDNGSINLLLQKAGLIDEPIHWLAVPEYFWGIVVGSNLWKEIGFSSIVYLAAIAGVSLHLYESAAIDGAGRFKRMILITVPSIMPVIIIFFILAIGNLLSAGFEDLLLLGKNPILREYSEVLDTYVFRTGIESGRYSYAAAAGLFKAVVSVGLLAAANAIARRRGHSLW